MKWVLALAGAALLAGAAPAQATPVQLKVSQRGESIFRVPRGVTQLKVTAVGEHGVAGAAAGGRGAEVTQTLAVNAGDALTLRVGTHGGAGGTGGRGGGLSGVFAATPLVVAAGGGGGASTAGGDAGAAAPGGGAAGTPGGALAGGQGTGGGGGAGFGGGAGSSAGGGGGVSYPSAGRLVDAAPSLLLEYEDADGPLVTVDDPGLNPELLTGTAGIEGGDATSVSVRFFPGSQVTPDPTSSVAVGVGPDGRFATVIGNLPDGQWTVQAVQPDVAGHTTYSEPVTFVVDQFGPEVKITSPGPLTNDAQTQIIGTPGSQFGDLAEVTVRVTGAGYDATVTADSIRGGEFRAVMPEPLADGRYTAVARQKDVYGHSGSATLVFDVDTVAPKVTLAGPDGDVTAARVSGTAAEPGSVQIDLFDTDGRLAGSARAPVVAGAFSAVVPAADGVYTARVMLYDSAGNAGVATRAFRLDSTGPAIDLGGVRATYRLGESAGPGFACTDPVGVAACDGPAIDTASAGAHTLTVTARDRLGNTSSATASYTVLAPPVAVVRKAAAALKIGKVTRRGRTVTIKGTAAKAATGTVTVTVAGVKKRVKLARGAWRAKVTLKRAPRKSSVVSASYSGDATHRAARAKKTLRVR